MNCFIKVWKNFCNCFEHSFCLIGSIGVFWGVKEIVLLDSLTILVIGLKKLSRAGLEGNGAICGSLALDGEIVPSDKKVVSLDGGGSGTSFDKGGKSQS